MIPLSLFILAWFVLIAIYAILAFVSIVQMTRYAITGPVTYLSTTVYLIVASVVIFGILLFLFTIDWNTAIDLRTLIPTPSFGIPV